LAFVEAAFPDIERTFEAEGEAPLINCMVFSSEILGAGVMIA
jgi:hypothetical protein